MKISIVWQLWGKINEKWEWNDIFFQRSLSFREKVQNNYDETHI